MVLPLVSIRIPGDMTAPMTLIENALNHTDAGSLSSGRILLGARTSSPKDIIGIILMTGAAVSLCMTIRSYIMMRRMMKETCVSHIDGFRVRIMDNDSASFSWGRDIMISRKDMEENPAILTHEMMHVRCGHSFDIMAYTVVTTLQWFNPLVWIARKELKMLHEYEADEMTINQGMDAARYQLLLVRKAVGEKRFHLANGFNHSKLKNRISMMHRERSSRGMKLAYMLFLPILAGCMCCCSEWVYENVSLVPYSQIEVKPRFQGDDERAFSRWVNTQLIYPKEAKENNIQGRVMMGFTIDTKGKLTDGKPVPVAYSFPVIFQLR